MGLVLVALNGHGELKLGALLDEVEARRDADRDAVSLGVDDPPLDRSLPMPSELDWKRELRRLR